MIKPLEIVNTHADHEENIERIVKILGRSKLRREIFEVIYGRGSKPKSVTQILESLSMKSRQRQLVLNEINHLSKHKIIIKSSVPGSGRGGKENGYAKFDFVMANKQEILRGQAKPKSVKNIPTKRRPQFSATINARTRTQRSGATARSKKLKVLYLMATPASQPGLRTDAEFRSVQRELRGSIYRNQIELISSPAADEKSILDGINDHRPQIVHFSGHAGGRGIWLDDGKIDNSVGRPLGFDLLTEALSATSTPPIMLVLNACDTLNGAQILLNAVKVVIGMADSILDIGAATFATQFYAAIASGQPISAALRQGKLSMRVAMLSGSHLPEMIHQRGVDPKKLTLVSRR